MNAARAENATTTRTAPRTTEVAKPTTDEGFPPGLTLLLAMLASFCVIVAYVLYLADQMP